VIKTFRHAGLEKFFKTGSKAGIQPKHATRLSIQLQTLDDAKLVSEMDVPGWHLHPLGQDLKDHWSVRVSGNWRVTFRFEDGNAILVDYQDDHQGD
jgi:toxin HigB-1